MYYIDLKGIRDLGICPIWFDGRQDHEHFLHNMSQRYLMCTSFAPDHRMFISMSLLALMLFGGGGIRPTTGFLSS
jgi:hypothetical protein